MTEEDAKTTRCCGPKGCGDLRLVNTVWLRFCIASNCMGWRELFEADSVEEPVGSRVRFTKIGGYCGLAGHK